MEAADLLGCTKSNVQRLIKQGRIDAEMQERPVRYYLVNPDSVLHYKHSPKNKGGRPASSRKSK